MPASTLFIVFGAWILLLVLALTARGKDGEGEDG